MINAAIQIEQLTIDEYVELYELEGAFEIIDGERIPIFPQVAIHGLIVKRLLPHFVNYENRTANGEAFTNMPFVLTDSKRWVKGSRVPDVMYFIAERLQTYRESVPDWKNTPFMLVPDFAIEVVSENDRYTKIQRKVETYQVDGVKLIWVIDPHREKVIAYYGEQQTTFSTKDTLSGEDVIPDFTVSIKDLLA